MTGRIRVLIADDEPLARGLLRSLLEERPEIDIIAETGTGKSTVAAIREHQPQLLFLDIQMPELDGFGVVEAVGPERMPAVVFVTAYDQYALRAFDVQALDYLLKPFDRERLNRALDRAIERLTAPADNDLGERLTELLGYLKGGRKYLARIPLKAEGRIRFVETERVDWIEADGKTVKIHEGKTTHVLRQTLSGLAEQLDPERFVRVHRSAIVNVASVQEAQSWFQGDFVLILKDGSRVTTGRQYRDGVRKLLGDHSHD